ncbi:MAG: SEC-C metal-binding domain-containing protein [Syntrophomonas sp.]
MSNNKVGRNDPCPCGSGKKYKNCCMHLDELTGGATDPFSRYSQVISSLKIKLDNQYAADLRKNKRETVDEFLHFSVHNSLPRDNETLFSDWLWFDRADNDGNTPGLRYMDENGAYLEKTWHDCLEALNNSYLSVYEPGKTKENYLLVQDIFSQENFRVLLQEPWIEDERTSNILLLGRLASLAEATIFTGMVLMVKNDVGEKEFLSKHVNYFQQLMETGELKVFLKNNADLLYGLFDHAYKKDMLRLNDIRCADISEHEKSSILKTLSQDNEVAYLYSINDFQWYEPIGCTGYTRLAVGENKVVTCVDLIDDWEVLEKILQRVMPQQLEKVSNLVDLPASKTNLWFLVMKDQETERWLGTPHQELDNKTPLQVLEEENGKDRLFAMLDSFAAQTAGSDEERELIAYMRERIK